MIFPPWAEHSNITIIPVIFVGEEVETTRTASFTLAKLLKTP
jgi:hypothetical protein